MKLEDTHNLKRHPLFKNYKDYVLDFLTVFIDYGLELYKFKKPDVKLPWNIEYMLAVRGLDYAKKTFNFKFPPLIELKAHFEDKLTNSFLKDLN
jgi:hypothetical protein